MLKSGSPGKVTGRGNINTVELERLKAYMYSHQEGCKVAEIAKSVGCSYSRAIRLMDMAAENGFLIYEDGEGRNIRYFALNRKI